MRLVVRDPADILRWAGAQQARHLCDFRHRVIAGREVVSFRLTPGYAIRIGTRDIVVVAHVRGNFRQALPALLHRLRLRLAARFARPVTEEIVARPAAPAPFPALRSV
jgi:hypothetical protein